MGQRQANQANMEEAGRSRAFTREENRLAREFNREEAETQRAWTTDMSNTQYQRSMADMKEAGLNPILGAMGGGATTGAGVAASSSGTHNSAQAEIKNELGAGLEGLMMLNSAKKLDAETKTEKERGGLIKAQTMLNTNSAKTEVENQNKIKKEMEKIQQDINIAKKNNKFYEADRLQKLYLEYSRQLDQISRSVLLGGRGDEIFNEIENKGTFPKGKKGKR